VDSGSTCHLSADALPALLSSSARQWGPHRGVLTEVSSQRCPLRGVLTEVSSQTCQHRGVFGAPALHAPSQAPCATSGLHAWPFWLAAYVAVVLNSMHVDHAWQEEVCG
jgi:hypothetical protein